MEFLIELLLDLFLDSAMEIAPNKKFPKWLRYTLGVLAFAVIGAVIVAIFVLGGFLMKDSIWIGLLFEGVGVVFLISFIYKIVKIKRQIK